MALAPPVQVVTANAPPFVQVSSGAPPFVVVIGNAPPIMLVADGAPPITLLNEDGSVWSAEPSFFLLETGDSVLLEDSSGLLILEIIYG